MSDASTKSGAASGQGEGTAGRSSTASRDLRSRTREFALRIIKLADALPSTTAGRVLGSQILRSGTSVGAHYREGQRARSAAEFISKLEGGLQELEETRYWLELIEGAGLIRASRLRGLVEESDELVAMFVASIVTRKASANAIRRTRKPV